MINEPALELIQKTVFDERIKTRCERRIDISTMRYLSEYSKQHLAYPIFRARFRLDSAPAETRDFPFDIAFFGN